MEDLLGVLMVPMVVFMVVVAPIWLVLHYRAKGRIGAGLADDEREQLQGLLVRAEKGAGGEVVVSAGGRSVAVSPEPAREGKWHEVSVATPTPGATALTVRLHGTTAVAEVRTG